MKKTIEEILTSETNIYNINDRVYSISMPISGPLYLLKSGIEVGVFKVVGIDTNSDKVVEYRVSPLITTPQWKIGSEYHIVQYKLLGSIQMVQEYIAEVAGFAIQDVINKIEHSEELIKNPPEEGKAETDEPQTEQF